MMNAELEANILREVPVDDSTAPGEKTILYALIKELRPTTVVETGTHRGLTTLYMAAALKDNGHGHISTADPNGAWNPRGNFRKFPELEKYISSYEMRGSEMISNIENIDFAFIDGFHEDFEVLEEWKVLEPRLSKTAMVVFHDCWYGDTPGVNEAIEKLGLSTIWLPTKNAMRIYSKHPLKPTGLNDL